MLVRFLSFNDLPSTSVHTFSVSKSAVSATNAAEYSSARVSLNSVPRVETVPVVDDGISLYEKQFAMVAFSFTPPQTAPM